MRVLRHTLLAFSVTLAAVGSAPSAAGFRTVEKYSADEIMALVDQRHAAQTEIELVQMRVDNADGFSEQRQLISLIKRTDDGRYRYLLRFTDPPEAAGTSVLILEGDDGELQQYLHLPDLGAPRRVSGNQRAEAFMDTDFTFEDLRKEKLSDHTYHRMLDAVLGGDRVYKIMSAPVSVDVLNASGYERRILYIDPETFDIRKIEFFEQGNASVAKIFRGEDFQPTGRTGIKRPRRVVMENIKRDSRTTLELLRIRLNAPLDDAYFTPKGLQNWSADDSAKLMALLNEGALR